MLNSKAETAMTLRLQIESYVLAAANMSTVAFMSERVFCLNQADVCNDRNQLAFTSFTQSYSYR